MSLRLAALGVALAWAWGCGGNAPCDLAGLVAEATPEDARDCGTGTLDDNGEVVACLASAFLDGVPFSGIVQVTALDGSLSAKGWVGDEAGVRIFDAAFSRCGAEGCQGVVREVVCETPVVREVDGASRLVCDHQADTCGEVVCGQGVDCEAD